MADKNGKESEELVQEADASGMEDSATAADTGSTEQSNAQADEYGGELGRIKKELAKVTAERDEFREHAMRKVAELENFRRRSEQEKADTIRYANHDLLDKTLPLLDDLHRAVESGRESKDYKSLQEGIELVYQKAMQIFSDAGVTIIEGVGKPFDVNLHEALMHMPSEHPEGTVIREVQRGYKYRDKVVRHAKVITSAGPAQNEETEE